MGLWDILAQVVETEDRAFSELARWSRSPINTGSCVSIIQVSDFHVYNVILNCGLFVGLTVPIHYETQSYDYYY